MFYAYIFVGLFFIFFGFTHYLRKPWFISKKILEKDADGQYQKGLFVPYCIAGVGFIAYSLILYVLQVNKSVTDTIFILFIIVAAALFFQNSKKLNK